MTATNTSHLDGLTVEVDNHHQFAAGRSALAKAFVFLPAESILTKTDDGQIIDHSYGPDSPRAAAVQAAAQVGGAIVGVSVRRRTGLTERNGFDCTVHLAIHNMREAAATTPEDWT